MLMKWKINVVGCVMLMMCAGVMQGGELPVVELEEGDNQIFLSVVNEGDIPFKGLWAEVKAEEVPSWIRIADIVQRVDVPKRSRGKEKLVLSIRIEKDMEGDVFELPLVLRDADGHAWAFRILAKVDAARPTSYALMQNTPNPFNPTTVIRYALASEEILPTQLVVFNTLGQKIRTLVDAPQAAGFYSVWWDGTDDQGQRLSSGVYVYRLRSGSFTQTHRMLLIE
jgi:hypothetical protein